MKIGVLTYHCVPNFGAQLQALSTISFLKRLGHEPIIINWYAKDLEKMYDTRIPRFQIEEHLRFMYDTLPITEKCQTEESLINIVSKYNFDSIIVGSDALFKYLPLSLCRKFSLKKLKYIYNYRPLSCEQIDENPFFGGFLRKTPNVPPTSVYAVSSQNCPFHAMSWIERRKMHNNLKNFKVISVRDEWTQQMIKSITGEKNISIFPDPVFAFNQNCHIFVPSKTEILKKFLLQPNYVLLSFSDWYIDSTYIDTLAKELEKHGFQPVAFPMPEKLVSAKINKVIRIPLSPIDWYALIAYSSGYIGERMHPIVVCLHNVVPFFSFDEYGTKDYRTKLFNLNSSKTYQIVSDAKLNNNLFSYKQSTSLPTAQFVVEKIKSFDYDRCHEFSIQKSKLYELGMKSIVNSLIASEK